MVVRFYVLSKKRNSTKTPTTLSLETNCKLRDKTSVISPVLIIERNVKDYNYVYIPSFNRYYFVNDIVSVDNLWHVYLNIDILGTYKEDILDSTQYVLRSALQYNSNIIDDYYPTVADTVITITDNGMGVQGSRYAQTNFDINDGVFRRPLGSSTWSVDRTYFNSTFTTGGFILGIVSNNGTGVTYYGFTRSDLVNFLQAILTITPSTITDVSNGLKSILFDALQYIVSLKWFPALPSTISGNYVSSINVGGYSVSVPVQRVFTLGNKNVEEFYCDVTLPTHPKLTSSVSEFRSLQYLRLSPYTQYNLHFQPYGDIPLDTIKLFYSSYARIKWNIDFTTGVSYLRVYNSSNQLVYETNAVLGVDLPVSNVAVKDATALAITAGYIALNTSHYNRQSLVNTENPVLQRLAPLIDIGNDITELTKSAMGKAVDFGADALYSSLGQLHTVGRPDSFLPYSETPFVYAWFTDIVQTDRERFGRPLNQKYRLQSLYDIGGGFVKCADANVVVGRSGLVATVKEQTMINDYLNSGIYLE